MHGAGKLAFAFLVLSSTAFGRSERTFEIKGNTRTKTEHIQSLIKVCLNDDDEALSDDSVLKQCLINSKLFSEVAVETKDGVSVVSVTDRWTLIPVPFAQAGSGRQYKYGLFLLDSNFLGWGKLLAVGGTSGTGGISYFVVYNDPAIFFSQWTLQSSLIHTDQDLSLYEGRGEVTDGFHEDKTTGVVSIGHKIGHFWPALSLSRHVSIYEVIDDFRVHNAYSATRVGVNMRYNSSSYLFYFDKGLKLESLIEHDLSRSDGITAGLYSNAKVNLGIPLFYDHALLLQVSAGKALKGGQSDMFRLGGVRGFRGIIAQGAWAEAYFSGTIDYQVPVKKMAIGTWTVAPFMDRGVIDNRGGVDTTIDYYAYGVGTYVFLKEVSIPGIGIEIGKNSRYQKRFATLSFGLGM